MSFIYNLKTRTKLLLSFSIVLILTVIIGINGLNTAGNLQKGFESFYTNNYLSNMILGEIRVNQEKTITEMQRILYKVEATHDRSVIDESVEVLNQIAAENDRLIQEYEATILTPEERGLVDQLKTVIADYRKAREEVIEAAGKGNFSSAVRINDEKTRALRDKTSDILSQLEEMNNQAAINTMDADKAEFSRSRNTAILLLIISLLLCAGLSVLLARLVVKPIRILVQHANYMAEGDFTHEIPQKLLRLKEEMGMLANAFAGMNEKIRTMLKHVADTVEDASASSQELSATAEEVSAQSESINTSVQQIAAGMDEISASVEEVATASADIVSKAKHMKEQAANGEAKVEEITKRAEAMKDSARLSKQSARDIYTHKQQDIKLAIEEVGVVEEITRMADAISEIAEQTNLLALNAAIEAARAGDQGLGFAVVAEEVRKLAENSANTAKDIHEVIRQVNGAVSRLADHAGEILKFIEEKVTPDYNMLEMTGEQYAEDARFVKKLTDQFAASASVITTSIEEIGKSIDGVAATVEEAAASAQEISSNSMESTKALEEVARTAQAQAEIAQKLSNMVGNFKV